MSIEKFGVDLSETEKQKIAARGDCPECGAKLDPNSSPPKCPNCGFEPFEHRPEVQPKKGT